MLQVNKRLHLSNHVDMASHDNKRIKFDTPIINKKMKAVYDDVFVLIALQ